MKENKLKILVSYHKPSTLIKNDIFIPIHVGRDLKDKESKDGKINLDDYNWLLENMIGDNTGDNISSKNREYCELTAIYWAWKNYENIGNPEYIGFMSYRRFLIFNEYEYDKYFQNVEEKTYREIFTNNIDKYVLDECGLNDKYIDGYINKYDVILPLKSELKLLNTNNSREDYIKNIPGVNVKDYDTMVDIVTKYYPEYKQYILEQTNTSRRYFYQIFIIRKDLFFDYCNFLFSILNKLENILDISHYSINGKRTLAYLGEALFDCYMRKLFDSRNVKYKELGVLRTINRENHFKYKKFIFLGFENTFRYFTIYLFGINIVIKKNKNIY
ncbi:DUF4422 domain-containing protein [Brachyspira intermedia]|uniref:DUF4422 domain-containing protein n=1 Tax=Brachyspira intermedia TaxID=84377 RepID=UPI0030044F81